MWTVDGLVRLDALAQRYHCRPSDLTGERDPYRAYCLDEACAIAAARVEQDTAQQQGPAAIEIKNGIPAISGAVPYIGE